MKKVFSLWLVLIILATCSLIFVSAMASPDAVYGDVNYDREVDVTDATYLQQCLAGIGKLSKISYELADFDGDGRVNVTDATQIQMYEARIIKHIPREPYAIYTRVDIENFACDFESGKAIASVPVTFTSKADVPYGEGKVFPITYEYTIKNGDKIIAQSERSLDGDLCYTFDKGGTYTVELKAYNNFDEYATYELEYVVLDEYDGSLMVSALYPSKFGFDAEYNKRVFTAYAYGGQGPYEYRFIDNETNVVQEFSESNSVTLEPVRNLDRHREFTMTVEIRDSKGDIVTKNCRYMVFANWPK